MSSPPIPDAQGPTGREGVSASSLSPPAGRGGPDPGGPSMTKLFHSVALGKFCSSGLCKGVWRRTGKEPQCAILLPGKLHLGLGPPPTCLRALPPSQLRSAIRMLSHSLQLLGLPSGLLPQPLQHVLMVLTQGNHLVWAREIRELCQHQSPICQTAPPCCHA